MLIIFYPWMEEGETHKNVSCSIGEGDQRSTAEILHDPFQKKMVAPYATLSFTLFNNTHTNSSVNFSSRLQIAITYTKTYVGN